jgi:predicted site-specific integrase-resolvase
MRKLYQISEHLEAESSDYLDRLRNKPEMATFFGVCSRTLELWMREGRIPYFRINRSVRFRIRDVLEHLQKTSRFN